MTKQQRKEKAYSTVNLFMRIYNENLKYAMPETIAGNKRFIEGMITGFNYTGIITEEEQADWLQEIYEVFSNMIFDKEIEIMRRKKPIVKGNSVKV